MSSGPNRVGKTQADKVQAKSKVPEHKLVRHRKKGWGMGFKCTGETHEAQVKQIRLSQWQETQEAKLRKEVRTDFKIKQQMQKKMQILAMRTLVVKMQLFN